MDSQSQGIGHVITSVKYIDDLDSRLDFALSENGSTRPVSAIDVFTKSLFSSKREGLGTSGSERSFQTKRE